MSVHKRDGRIVNWDDTRIFSAVLRAARDAKKEIDDEKSRNIAAAVMVDMKKHSNEDITVEQIQDYVEEDLMQLDPEIARSYIIYRKRRSDIREGKTNLAKTLSEILNKKASESALLRENGNINGDAPMAKMLRIGSESSKDFYLRNMISPKFARLHKEGYWHIHDLDFYALTINCCQIDLGKLLKNGFNTGHGYIRPPKSIRSAASLACIVLQSNQNDMFGGQSLPNFDYDLAPYVGLSYRKNFLKAEECAGVCYPQIERAIDDAIVEGKSVLEAVSNTRLWGWKLEAGLCVHTAWDWTEEETYQAMEALIFNLNSMHSRAGAQTPFTSISYGTCTSLEGRMIIGKILDALEAGLGNGETPIFPIHIFRILDGKNGKKEDPNYDLYWRSLEVSAKRLFPNWVFLDAPFNSRYIHDDDPKTYMATMGCRTRVLGNVHSKDDEVTPGRGNLSFTTLNLPRLAIESDRDPEVFKKKVAEYTNLAFGQLRERMQIQGMRLKRNFPFLMGQGVWMDSDKLSDDDQVLEVLKHGTMSVGFIGLAEAMVALFGKHHGEDEDVAAFAFGVIKMMRDMCDERSEMEHLNYSLFATPAEGLSGRFTRMDRERFGVLKGVTDREYYTNSNHVPVYFPISAEKKIRIEAPYHELCNAGNITYIEMDGDPSKNIEAMDTVVQYMRKCNISYGSINHPNDRCPECGFVGVINEICPQCKRHEDEHMTDAMHEELLKKGILKQ